MKLHPNEINNIAYVACWYGHGIVMDGELYSKIRLELPINPEINDIIRVASDHSWRLRGRPDKVHYLYKDRTNYASAVAYQFMTLPESLRQDINKVNKHDVEYVILGPTRHLC